MQDDYIKELLKQEIELTNELTKLTKDLHKVKETYVKSITKISLGIIVSFTILISVFYICYFTSDYATEIEAKNTTTHNENYTEYKEYREVKD